MRWLRRARDEETGASLVLITAAAVTLFGMAALAVDVGHGYGERRRVQTAVDTSVLAGVLEVALGNTSLQALADEAVNLMDQNLPDPITIAEWEDDSLCSDSPPPLGRGLPAGFTSIKEFNKELGLGVVPDTYCISISASAEEARVTMPTREIDTFFAPVIGIDTMSVNSFAQAHLVFEGVANPPPFVALQNVASGDEVCLRAGSGGPLLPPQWQGNGPGPPGSPLGSSPTDPSLSDHTDPANADPCDDTVYSTSSEFFGTLHPHMYEEHNPAPPDVQCSQPGSNAIDFAIAAGIDHELGIDWDPALNNEKVDGTGCPQGPALPFPNTMELQSGFTAQRLRDGLLDGATFDGDFYPGRLQLSMGGPPARFAGQAMENRPPWEFIRDTTGLSPGDRVQACEDTRSAYRVGLNGFPPGDYDYYDLKEMMIQCLRDWKKGDAYIFDSSIAGSSLFAFIPQVAETSLLVSPVHFVNFVPAYLQKLYQAGNQAGSPHPHCFVQHPLQTGNAGWYMHEAGQDFDCGRPNQNVDALSAIIIDCGMLHEDLCDPTNSPGGNPKDPGGLRVASIELTR